MSEAMVLPYLPSDLVDEILSRVPATSLARFRYTCKRWNALIKDSEGFSEMQLRRAPKQHRVLMLKENRVSLTTVNFKYVSHPSIEFHEDALLSLKETHSNDSKQVDIAKVHHCDGLLLCITRDNRLVVVWNPCLGETRWIQRKNGCTSRYNRHCSFALGYENKQSHRSYKILMYVGGESKGFEIYELSSNSWKVVDAPNFYGTRYSGVCLNGNTYWVSGDGYLRNDYLQSFDFTRERFRRLCLPHSLMRRRIALSLFREELSLLCYTCFNESGEIEMWVTDYHVIIEKCLHYYVQCLNRASLRWSH